MKLKSFALSMACVMAVTLTGCSANRDTNSTAPTQPSNSVPADNGDRASAGINGTDQNSAGIDDARHSSSVQNSANVGNDAAQGGGAGGTNDRNNDGNPDRVPSNSGNMVDDIGDAAGDLARGAGNAVRDAGNAIGNAANDVGRAMR